MRISDWSSDVCSSDLDQHHRALDQATAEHPVELADAGTHARVLVVAHVLERGHLRRVYIAGPSAAARCGRLLRGSGFEHDLRQRVPRATGAALSFPLDEVRAAFATDVAGPSSDARREVKGFVSTSTSRGWP